MKTCTQDYTSVSGTTGDGIDGAVLHVRRIRWTADEALARRVGTYVSTRYRHPETGECVAPSEDAVPEYMFTTPMDADGRTFGSWDEARAFALERGYLRRFFAPELRAHRLMRAAQGPPRCGACGQLRQMHKGDEICVNRECDRYGDAGWPQVTASAARAASRAFAAALAAENRRAIEEARR